MRELQLAADIAAAARDEKKDYFLGCVAKRKDGVLVSSTNQTIILCQTPNLHAEARALRKAGQGAILWVARVLRDKKTWALAKPCKTCRPLIINKGVVKVYYTIGPNEYGVWFPGKNVDIDSCYDL